jgi:polyphosphate kinase
MTPSPAQATAPAPASASPAAAAPAPDLTLPELYLNRELSLLEFNRRVLAQAQDESLPLLERLKFLCISSTNLDEFFEIRVAGLMQRVELGSNQTDADRLSPQELLRQIGMRAHALVDEQYEALNESLIPALQAAGIRFLRRKQWSPEQAAWLRRYFETDLLPVLSPIGLDPAHPFPRILNKSLNFIVSLHGRDAFGRNSGFAIVGAPRSLPRLVRLPPKETGNGDYDFVFLSSIIHQHVKDLFPGMRVTGCYQFRVTRNSDLFVDEEETEDLLRAVEGELSSRRYGDGVRLEVAHECPDPLCSYLLERFQLQTEDLYKVNGPVNVNRLMAIYDLVDRPDLKFPAHTPQLPQALAPGGDIFVEIRKQDILLHHPFDSFLPVVEFLKQAAADPQVLAIKQTLYRTGAQSSVVDALVAAARAGKEVTVVVELRARFDEAENIGLATRLQEVGAHVVYGVVGYKTHAKMTLVVRREDNGLRNYVHLGTGNYHPRTARLYTDYGLLTAQPAIGQDVHKLFLQLTSLGKASKLEKLLDAPFTLYKALLERIQRETEHAQQGRPARIIAKMNALVEPELIRALYAAAMAGVSIDLIVRAMCCLKPGLPGISENIRVRSIVGRFLEHTRVFYFQNGGNPEYWLASADWMERNFFRRVEACFPIEGKQLQKRIWQDLQLYLEDNVNAWELQTDGVYRRCRPAAGEEPRPAQQRLMAEQTPS